MALNVKCKKCGEELNEQGALLFGPPDVWSEQADKMHLCENCYNDVLDFLGI